MIKCAIAVQLRCNRGRCTDHCANKLCCALQKQTLLVLERQTTVSGVPSRLHDTQHQLEIIHTGYLQSH